jgi:hypothetical protein
MQQVLHPGHACKGAAAIRMHAASCHLHAEPMSQAAALTYLWPNAMSSQLSSLMVDAGQTGQVGGPPRSGQRLMLLGALGNEEPGDAELHALAHQAQHSLQAQAQQHTHTHTHCHAHTHTHTLWHSHTCIRRAQ